MLDPLLDRFLVGILREHKGNELKTKIAHYQVLIWEKLRSFEGRKKSLGYLHPSSIACLRKVVFDHLIPKRVDLSEEAKVFKLVYNVGDSFHARMQALLLAMSDYPDSGVRTSLDLTEHGFHDEERRIEGTADQIAYLNDELYIIDYKSIGPRRFAALPDSALPKDEPQIRAYMRCKGIAKGLLYYESKDAIASPNGGVREFVITGDCFAVDTAFEQVADTILRDAPLPPRPSNNPDLQPCKWCDHVSTCFTTCSTKILPEMVTDEAKNFFSQNREQQAGKQQTGNRTNRRASCFCRG